MDAFLLKQRQGAPHESKHDADGRRETGRRDARNGRSGRLGIPRAGVYPRRRRRRHDRDSREREPHVPEADRHRTRPPHQDQLQHRQFPDLQLPEKRVREARNLAQIRRGHHHGPQHARRPGAFPRGAHQAVPDPGRHRSRASSTATRSCRSSKIRRSRAWTT